MTCVETNAFDVSVRFDNDSFVEIVRGRIATESLKKQHAHWKLRNTATVVSGLDVCLGHANVQGLPSLRVSHADMTVFGRHQSGQQHPFRSVYRRN
ncbi:MAG: hypothetical protein AAGJ40_02570 [Planctomycetota bacterium]